MDRRASIHVNGIVQGVGFRPYVYRLAKSAHLNGTVRNLGDAGVLIILEGEDVVIKRFIHDLQTRLPSIARIDSLNVRWEECLNSYSDFFIEKSSESTSKTATPVIPPDIAICDECIRDLFDSNSRWRGYAFTSCAACGPRFSTIIQLPYDRPNTTMADFPLCDTCNTGYTNPLDRRYHAQTTACEACGPEYVLRNGDKIEVPTNDPILLASRLLQENKIGAIQGIAGTHLVTITSDPSPIHRLRKRKNRPERPFAIMIKSPEVLQDLFDVSEAEYELMNSWRRPIVLVKKKDGVQIPSEVLHLLAPGLDSIGVMLPYAPVHHLLFHYLDEVALVMTSANPTGIPMYISPTTIMQSLNGIADFFLLHNRRIHQRADDSVVKFIGEDAPLFLRRSRGYVPEPISIANAIISESVIGVAAEEKAMPAILKLNNVYPTQYIGDITNIESMHFLEDALLHLSKLIGADKIGGIACDLHPEFLTSEFAEQKSRDLDIPLFRVQHHHAHLSSMIADHNLPINNSIVCITADGFGYGADGKGWGGEVLFGDCNEFENVGGLESHVLPGGDLSARFGSRAFIGLVREYMEANEILRILEKAPIGPESYLNMESLRLLIDAVDSRVNVIETSSAGRFLDSVASVLGVCNQNTYDGECPMKLEAVAVDMDVRIKPSFSKDGKRTVLNTGEAIGEIVRLAREGVSKPGLAYAAQRFLGEGLATIAIEIADMKGTSHIGFSGGVALNRIISNTVISMAENHEKIPLIHRRVPPGDGGVAVGQVMTAAANLSDEND